MRRKSWQKFSETPIALSLSQRGISLQYIADVKDSTGTRVFSDGVVTISRSALQEVWDCLPAAGPTDMYPDSNCWHQGHAVSGFPAAQKDHMHAERLNDEVQEQ